MKRERLEDLGVINASLKDLLDRFEDKWPYFESKHSYEKFQADMVADECNALLDLHTSLRFFKQSLWDIWSIAHGDEDE